MWVESFTLSDLRALLINQDGLMVEQKIFGEIGIALWRLGCKQKCNNNNLEIDKLSA